MRVAIDAQLIPGGDHGGTEQVVISLVGALGKLDCEQDEYVIISHWRDPDWLRPYLGPNQSIVTLWSRPGQSLRNALWVVLRRVASKSLAAVRRLMPRLTANVPAIPRSKGFYESLGVDLVYFAFQSYVRSSMPSIYNPHDLQHLHYPQFFAPEQVAMREALYRAGCAESRAITVPSKSAKDDIVQQYGIAPGKIYVTYWAPPADLYPDVTDTLLSDVASKYQLPQAFAFYPAQTWQHKNHLRLLEAIALLRDRDGIPLNLICTGKQNDFWRTIARRIRELRLEQQTRFLGFVKPDELRALYHLAQFVVHPSLFEGGGLPVLEAFRAGVPVACSNVTSLPEYAGNAALLFDPTDVASIADALRQMATNVALREELRQRGSERIRLFTWERTAKMYRALYRQVAGVPLSEEDSALLAEA